MPGPIVGDRDKEMKKKPHKRNRKSLQPQRAFSLVGRLQRPHTVTVTTIL